MSGWNVWRWNRKSIRVWATSAFSGAALATLSGVIVELRAETGDSQAVETRITRDGHTVSRPLRPMTPRRQYESAEDIRARAAKMKQELGRGRQTVPETPQSALTTTYRAPSQTAPTVAGTQGSVPVLQVRDRRTVEANADESDNTSAVQRKLNELYERDNLVPPPMTLKELKRQDGRRFAQRAPRDHEDEKPSLLHRLNPFSRIGAKEEDENPADASDSSASPHSISEPKIRKMTKHYRRPTSRQTEGVGQELVPVPEPQTADSRRSSKTQATGASRRSRSDVEARPAASSRAADAQLPANDLPVIVPQDDADATGETPDELPTVVPEIKREEGFDLDLDLPLPASPGQPSDADAAANQSRTPSKLSKLGSDEDAPRLSQIPAEIDPATEAKLQLIAARGAIAGLKGFCPVALRNERELKDAQPDFNSIYQGIVYGFSSREAKVTFDTDPDIFVPVLQGRDVVLQASHVEAPGSLDYALWYQDRLFLFSSPETMQQFSDSPDQYTK